MSRPRTQARQGLGPSGCPCLRHGPAVKVHGSPRGGGAELSEIKLWSWHQSLGCSHTACPPGASDAHVRRLPEDVPGDVPGTLPLGAALLVGPLGTGGHSYESWGADTCSSRPPKKSFKHQGTHKCSIPQTPPFPVPRSALNPKLKAKHTDTRGEEGDLPPPAPPAPRPHPSPHTQGTLLESLFPLFLPVRCSAVLCPLWNVLTESFSMSLNPKPIFETTEPSSIMQTSRSLLRGHWPFTPRNEVPSRLIPPTGSQRARLTRAPTQRGHREGAGGGCGRLPVSPPQNRGGYVSRQSGKGGIRADDRLTWDPGFPGLCTWAQCHPRALKVGGGAQRGAV